MIINLLCYDTPASTYWTANPMIVKALRRETRTLHTTEWSFITNHGRVLGYIYRYPKSTAREIAGAIGITERTTHKIISDLAETGYIVRKRKGRRNIYKVEPGLPAVADTNRKVIVGDLLSVVGRKGNRMARIRTEDYTLSNGNGYSGQMKLLID